MDKQTRLTGSRLQHQYMTRNEGNDMVTYNKQYWTHDKNKPIRTWQWTRQPIRMWHKEQGNQYHEDMRAREAWNKQVPWLNFKIKDMKTWTRHRTPKTPHYIPPLPSKGGSRRPNHTEKKQKGPEGGGAEGEQKYSRGQDGGPGPWRGTGPGVWSNGRAWSHGGAGRTGNHGVAGKAGNSWTASFTVTGQWVHERRPWPWQDRQWVNERLPWPWQDRHWVQKWGTNTSGGSAVEVTTSGGSAAEANISGGTGADSWTGQASGADSWTGETSGAYSWTEEASGANSWTEEASGVQCAAHSLEMATAIKGSTEVREKSLW